MANEQVIKIPDIGGATGVEVIEILVSPGDSVNKEQPLLTLESDKASMDVPSPMAGVVKELRVKVSDKVQEGDEVLVLEVGAAAITAEPQQAAVATAQEVVVPEIGGAQDVEVIEVSIAPGDQIAKDDPMITLESDKASMDVPAPFSGKVQTVKLKVGDKVSAGAVIAIVEGSASTEAKQKTAPSKPATTTKATTSVVVPTTTESSSLYAGPGVRRLARELDINLEQIRGTGAKGRITKDDLHQFIKGKMQGSGFAVPEAPAIDFSQWGVVEIKPLSRINKLSGANLHRNWITVPHVTQFDEADITEMEEFRKQQKAQAEKQGFKLTPLVFIMKAVVASLKAFPRFNSSMDRHGENLIVKQYYNLGIAVDTPDGLMVPVVRNVDQKEFLDLAKELGEISEKARNKKLTAADMQGSCFTISSLGGIGGTAFTPIINAPDVAILGVSRAAIKPVYKGEEFVPRLMLPLSLSYDHRVIDGAEGARFSRHLVDVLSDIRTLLL